MRQVIRQALDVFACLLLPPLHLDDLCDQHVIGLPERLSGHIRWPREPPIRHRVQRPANEVAIRCHQTLKLLRQLRRAQLKPDEKGRRSTHAPTLVQIPTWMPPSAPPSSPASTPLATLRHIPLSRCTAWSGSTGAPGRSPADSVPPSEGGAS